MHNSKKIQVVLDLAKKTLTEIFGDKLNSLYLYGSYATGCADDESDIDIIAIVAMDKEELSKYRRVVSAALLEIDLEHDVLLSAKLQDLDTFNKYKHTLPYFKNVLYEGVKII